MALANFFDKTAFGIAQVLHGGDTDSFSERLHAHRICVRYSSITVTRREGIALLDLLTRLLTRLYPQVRFLCTDQAELPVSLKLMELARSINPAIECAYEGEDTIVITVGPEVPDATGAQQFFTGSDRWVGYFSTGLPQPCNDSDNPFGAGLAACLTAANVFRFVFRDKLSAYALDGDLAFSVFDYSVNEEVKQGPLLRKVRFEDTILVGLGAIGNGTAWALKHLPIKGTLSFVDPEIIALSNLQRYILATQRDVGKPKADHLGDHLHGSGLGVACYTCSWQTFLNKRGNWSLPLVGAALDSAADRIAVQASLPQKVLNAWTQREQLGISRHVDFVENACLACLYLPSAPRPSLSEEIAASLNIPHLERDMVRRYLADRLCIDELLIQVVAGANHISAEELRPFVGKSMEAFYSEVVCGGVFMRLTGNVSSTSEIHVPSAFESALAGIFLAAELYKAAAGVEQSSLANTTKINLIRPITIYTLDHAPKDQTGRCICRDSAYLVAYRRKWEGHD